MIDNETLDQVVAFHGHMCPGLAMGVQAAEIARRDVGTHAVDEEIVAIVETDMCAVDAIQFLTGCTFGKGNLIHRDYGKNAYTFLRRSDGKAVRLVTRPGGFGPGDPTWEELFARVRAGTASAAEEGRFRQLHLDRARRVLAAQPEDLYAVSEVATPLPRTARIHASVTCSCCGEPTMETRIRRLGGADLCIPCFERSLTGPSGD